MSNTRHAEKGTPFRQEKFASSAEFERGLLANLVAKRCELLNHEEQRNLIWWLQLRSWNEGGLARLAADLLAAHPARVATKSMQEFGFKPGQNYTLENIKALRAEIPHEKNVPFYPCKGEIFRRPSLDCADDCDPETVTRRDQAESQKHPAYYPASVFVEKCQQGAKALSELLAEICLDPSIYLKEVAPWYFPRLMDTLRETMAAEIASKQASAVITELGRIVYETLDYCQQGRCMVLIDGLARTGKTHAAKAWCAARPGSTRYIQIPSTNDDIGFFRAIARALGVSINLNAKAQQLRDRVEEVLLRGHLTVVFDEAHYLWPQSNYRDALPGRVNWIMTALVNQGVPVALVTTPQFMRTQKAIERKSCWTSEQFIGRIGLYKPLPDSLSSEDLAAVAKGCLPEGCANSIKALVLYAQGSAKYLAAIESVVRRARFLASKTGRAQVTFADVKNAINESVIPSDTALAIALAEPKKQGRSRAISAPVQAQGNDLETPLQATRETRPATPGRPQDFTADTAIVDRSKGNLAAVE